MCWPNLTDKSHSTESVASQNIFQPSTFSPDNPKTIINRVKRFQYVLKTFKTIFSQLKVLEQKLEEKIGLFRSRFPNEIIPDSPVCWEYDFECDPSFPQISNNILLQSSKDLQFKRFDSRTQLYIIGLIAFIQRQSLYRFLYQFTVIVNSKKRDPAPSTSFNFPPWVNFNWKICPMKPKNLKSLSFYYFQITGLSSGLLTVNEDFGKIVRSFSNLDAMENYSKTHKKSVKKWKTAAKRLWSENSHLRHSNNLLTSQFGIGMNDSLSSPLQHISKRRQSSWSADPMNNQTIFEDDEYEELENENNNQMRDSFSEDDDSNDDDPNSAELHYPSLTGQEILHPEHIQVKETDSVISERFQLYPPPISTAPHTTTSSNKNQYLTTPSHYLRYSSDGYSNQKSLNRTAPPLTTPRKSLELFSDKLLDNNSIDNQSPFFKHNRQTQSQSQIFQPRNLILSQSLSRNSFPTNLIMSSKPELEFHQDHTTHKKLENLFSKCTLQCDSIISDLLYTQSLKVVSETHIHNVNKSSLMKVWTLHHVVQTLLVFLSAIFVLLLFFEMNYLNSQEDFIQKRTKNIITEDNSFIEELFHLL